MQLLRRYAALPGYTRFLSLVILAIPFWFLLPHTLDWIYIGVVAALAFATLVLGPGREVRG